MEVDMKIKRYTAPSMRVALSMVRAEQGPDAVILSSRRGEDGIEVIAAIDYDEALFAEAKRQRAAAYAEPAPAAAAPAVTAAPATVEAPAARAQAPTPVLKPSAPRAAPSVGAASRPAVNLATKAATPSSIRPAVPATPAPAARPIPAPSPVRMAAPRPDIGYSLMQREMQEMRRLLETGMAGMTWSDKRLREPLKARVLEVLTAMDISPDVAMSIAQQTPQRTSLDDPSNIPLALLVKHLPMVVDMANVVGGITALVGPTGAGKTTTIAKLAARWSLQHGPKDVALISTDAYRIGAREQLLTYARILDVPMHTANSGKELARVLERLSDKRLILIDTAGMGPRDVRLTEQLAALKLGAAKAKVLLALPAQAEGQALDDIVRAYARVNPAACIITKVDEAASLGGVLSAVIRHKLKIAYVCDGQRVPEDLHSSQQRRVWLVRAAQQLKKGARNNYDEAYMARHFGRASAHA
jgi:flagellar biosynthesis protein FlhF